MKKSYLIYVLVAVFILFGSITAVATNGFQTDTLGGKEEGQSIISKDAQSKPLKNNITLISNANGLANKVTTKNTNVSQTTSSFISAEKAIKIAANTVNGTVKELERNMDNGLLIYEVDLQSTKGAVTVKIDAENGKVLGVKYHNRNKENNVTKTKISAEKAMVLALDSVNGAVKRLEKDDNDDGFVLYKVEVQTVKGPATVKIDATNGKVIGIQYHEKNVNDDDD